MSDVTGLVMITKDMGSRSEDTSKELENNETWIAIEPPPRRPLEVTSHPNPLSPNPPSFASSQFDIILRRQRQRHGLKIPGVPSRFLNLSNDFEFAGWGSASHLQLTSDDFSKGEEVVKAMKEGRVLSQWTATALVGNAVLGGVFYTLPAVVGVAGVYSPISLFIATLTLFIWRPIMEELASALPISGAPYMYLINITTKSLALIGAVLQLLDFAAACVVSAATASSYLAGEVKLPFPPWVGVVFVFVIFTAVSLSGVKESARIALVVFTFHVVTMVVLTLASAIRWGQIGNGQLKANWFDGQLDSGKGISRQIFNGFCIWMLGLTGFECASGYVSLLKPGCPFPSVLRNVHLPVILLDSVTMLLVLALVPLERVLGGSNVLSILAEIAVGRWLRIWVVVDAIVVLCAGVLTGILSACQLLQQLSLNRVVPHMFLRTLKWTGAPYVTVLCFMAFSGVLYASAGSSLKVVSKMFSLVWLTMMALFPLSLLLLKFNRGRLPRAAQTGLGVIFAALAVAVTVFAGNIAVDPVTAGYFAIYFSAILLLFLATQNKARLLWYVYWAYDQNPIMHRWTVAEKCGEKLIKVMGSLRRQEVVILVSRDEINYLFQMILYVRQSEETSCLKIVHFYDEEGAAGVPSELEANARILDEAFPDITVDLVLVPATFTPVNVVALAYRLQINRSLMFMSCPGVNYSVAEFGTRVVAL